MPSAFSVLCMRANPNVTVWPDNIYGKSEIRTLGRFITADAFQERCLNPLGQLPKKMTVVLLGFSKGLLPHSVKRQYLRLYWQSPPLRAFLFGPLNRSRLYSGVATWTVDRFKLALWTQVAMAVSAHSVAFFLLTS